MNYPPANLWIKLEPEIEQRVACQPELVDVLPSLRLPAEWPEQRRSAFVDRWIRSDALTRLSQRVFA